ncbi:MAG TPA: hypothetical protein VFE65_02000 [Pseudonocardia sp.]|nr:hypothetical protein [Pseudonocardia sp.]
MPEETNRLIEVLVAQARDDLDEGRFSLEHALRMIGYLAWAAGFERA